MTYPAHGDLNYDGPLKTYIDQADAAIQADATQAALDAAAAVEGLEERPPRIAGGLTASAAELRYYNVKDYEAVGDGGTDDLAGITAAIDAAYDAGGGIVGVVGGDWKVSDSIVLKPGVHLLGSGKTATTISPLNFPHEFTLIKNYRATQPSGSNDTNMGVYDMTLDGLSTGESDDDSVGYGIELYGATRVNLERLHLRDIPLSGIEISGNYAGVAVNGVDYPGTAPNAFTTDIVVRDVTGNHIGWQKSYLAGADLVDWGDAGFGVIARSAARRVTFDNIYMTECSVGTHSVGQMDGWRGATSTPLATWCVAEVTMTGCIGDQTTAVALTGRTAAPAIRVAFAFNVNVDNCTAIGCSDSSGFDIRSAGSTVASPNERITVNNCQSIGNDYGFNASQQNTTNLNHRIVFSGCIAQDSVTSGFNSIVPNVSMVGCQSYGSGSNGFRIQYSASDSATALLETNLTGCQSVGNGAAGYLFQDAASVNATGCVASGNATHGFYLLDSTACTVTGNTSVDNGTTGAATDCGVLLHNTTKTTVSGNTLRDSRAGGSREQDYGVRETGTSNLNMVAANVADNHAVVNYAPISVTSKWGDQIGDVRTAIKPSDTTKNNNSTIAADPDLTLELLPNSRYLVKLVGVVDGSNTADIKWNFTIPAGATGYQQPDGLAVATTGTTGSMNEAASLWTATPAIATAGVGTKTMFTPQGILITGATGGTFTFNWAQSTADATDTTLFAGSTLSVVRI